MDRFSNRDQLRSFMKKESQRLGISIKNTYSTFISRSFLEKLSQNPDKKLILVKGSSAETTYLGRLVRGITDVDLASIHSLEFNKSLIESFIDDQKVNGLDFKMKKDPYTTPTGIYKFTFSANLEKMNETLNVDFHENYDRLIERTESIMPKIFEGDKEFTIYTPSYEEYLAEKLCIILESNDLTKLNTRLKDFYDIYELHGGKYESEKLAAYFKWMLELRAKIALKDSTTDYLDKQFVEKHLELWQAIGKKYDFLDREIDLQGAVYYTRAVLRENLQRNGVYIR